MSTHTADLGVTGERIARQFYEDGGFKLIDANYRSKAGEIDLIVGSDPGSGPANVVFVEVKTRRGRGFGTVESVSHRKMARMRKVAAEWLRGKPLVDVRFDVVEVLIRDHDDHAQLRVFQGVDDGSC
ncbi:YraN family protein [Corynebacterium aquatimens]|uniref:UPF0102 protein IW254_000849 n=1 Tax=Corynebacterium aquatimens TaxID=1190508 RepID=A0A931DXF1_9CORY|nr:YraN family protein [Corynebacterium aquatimens]MBG6121880.1 putative endonuclease [Corynebacterium aquatimens]WJY65582.1 hypothetical protein CAQUA_04345 [Corynebacterium aquatimens]